MVYHGACHCGKIRFKVEGDITSLMDCNCSHCHKKGYLLWFIPRDQVTLSSRTDDLATYTFNKHLIQHHFCPTCGCAPFGFGHDGQGNAVAAVNARCLDDIDLASYAVNHHDGLSN